MKTKLAQWTQKLKHNLIALQNNAIVQREMRSRMRGGRAFLTVTFYLGILGLAVASVLLIAFTTNNITPSIEVSQALGKSLFGILFGMELLAVSFIAPALTAGAIATERERQTFDLLRATLLTPTDIVLGKLSSALSYMLLLLFSATPFFSMALLFGGVEWGELLIAFAMLVVTAVAFSAAGLFFSALVNRTLIATVLTYGFTSLVTFGVPMFLAVVLALMGPLLGSGSFGSNPWFEGSLLLVGWVLCAINPGLTVLVSELILAEENSLFMISVPLSNGPNLILLSPWIGYLLFYIFLSLFLITLGKYAVRRIEA
ncbi:MAG: ABC transporter permease [Anaerolineales bacterium]